MQSIAAGSASDINAANLAASSGSSLIGFIHSGTGAVARTTQNKMRDVVSVKDFGAVGDGVTDDTAKIEAADLAVSTAGGGVLFFPRGTYMVSSVTRRSNVSWLGESHNVSIIKCNTVGAAFITFQNISRISDRDIQFDGNLKANVTWKFAATVGNSCTSMLFEHVYLTGALVDTVDLVDSGGGSGNDISHLTFLQSYLRSAAPSNSQIKNSAANGLNIVFLGGIISAPGAGSPYNIDLQTGQVTCFETFFAGSTSYDIQSNGGQIKIYGGRTEGTGGFFHGLSTDTTGLVQAPHIIEGVQGSNAGTNFVYNESTRVLALDGNQSTSIIRCGANGVIEKGTHTYSSASTVDTIDAGGQIYSKGTAPRNVRRREAAPNFEVFYQMSNDQTGYNDYAWCAGSAANDIALRNVTQGYTCIYIQNGTDAGDIGLGGKTTALATTAIEGFAYLPTCSGTPTGVPTGLAGHVAAIVDSTNHKLYFYSGGAWRDAGP